MWNGSFSSLSLGRGVKKAPRPRWGQRGRIDHWRRGVKKIDRECVLNVKKPNPEILLDGKNNLWYNLFVS
jgi:hypothetical protein